MTANEKDIEYFLKDARASALMRSWNGCSKGKGAYWWHSYDFIYSLAISKAYFKVVGLGVGPMTGERIYEKK